MRSFRGAFRSSIGNRGSLTAPPGAARSNPSARGSLSSLRGSITSAVSGKAAAGQGSPQGKTGTTDAFKGLFGKGDVNKAAAENAVASTQGAPPSGGAQVVRAEKVITRLKDGDFFGE